MINEKQYKIELKAVEPLRIGAVEESQVGTIRNVITDFESEMKQWLEYLEMEKLFNRISHLGIAIRELVTVILLRRIVPGKCKFCPL